MNNILSWFEIPALDFARAVQFYKSLLNIEINSEEFGPYQMGFLRVEEGGISGSIVKGEGYKPSENGVVIYLNGENDLSPILSKVEGLGGKIIMPKTLISEQIGYYAFFLDPEGNKIGLFSQH